MPSTVIGQASTLESASVHPMGLQGNGVGFNRNILDPAQKMNSILGDSLNLTSLSDSHGRAAAASNATRGKNVYRDRLVHLAWTESYRLGFSLAELTTSGIADLLGLGHSGSPASNDRSSSSPISLPLEEAKESMTSPSAVGTRRPLRGSGHSNMNQFDHSTLNRPTV